MKNLRNKSGRTKKNLDRTLDNLSNQLDNLAKQLHPDYPTICVEWECPWDDPSSCPAGPQAQPSRSAEEGCKCKYRGLNF